MESLTEKDAKRIEALIEMGNPNATALKQALEAYKKEAENKKVEEMLSVLRKLDAEMERRVAHLRYVREVETTAKRNVIALDKAKTEYEKSGDTAVFKGLLSGL